MKEKALNTSVSILRALRFIVLFIFAIIVVFIAITLFIPTPSGYYYRNRNPNKKIALNVAATVAQAAGTYLNKTDSTEFIGNKAEYGKWIYVSKKDSVKLPEDFNCSILDSVVVVTHKDGTQEEVRWR